jgi:hypothetical protein
MKKTTLFFAMTLAMVSAAFSQVGHPTPPANGGKGGSGQAGAPGASAQTLTYDQFMSNPKKYDGQSITLTDVVVDASPVATKEMTCKINPDQVKVAIAAKGAAKTPSKVCFKGDKKTFDLQTKQGKMKFNATLSIMGNEKDGYTISNPKFGAAVN